MPLAPAEDTDIYYEVHGSGPPVVFAHGSGGNHLSWWQQIPFFSKHYTCITFDHRTFGQTRDGAEPKGRTAFADDLKALLDHLEMEQVAIVAHSMGGRTGVGFTLRNPGRVWGLVLSGSNGGSVNDESRQLRIEQLERNRALPAGTIKGLSSSFADKNPESLFLYRQIMRLNPRHAADFLEVPPGFRGSTHERLAESGVPILYIVGEQDIMSPPATIEVAASQIPQANLIRVPDTGHSVYYERPERFNNEVLGFLNEIMPSARLTDA